MRTDALHVIEMPSRRSLARYAGRTVLVVSVLPALIFLASYRLAGLDVAIAAALSWYYLGLAIRFARGHRVLVAMSVGAVIVTIRAVTTWLTGSAVIYFLQPVAGTVAMATAMAGTALAGRPMLDRLAHEFCPFPDELSHRLRTQRFFTRLSFVWASAYLVNAAGTIWLLSASSLGGFLVLKSVLSPILTGVAIVLSYALLRVTLHRDGVRIRFGAAAVA